MGLFLLVAAIRVGGPFERGISGCERQRTTIGVGLVTDPSILCLDVCLGKVGEGGIVWLSLRILAASMSTVLQSVPVATSSSSVLVADVL